MTRIHRAAIGLSADETEIATRIFERTCAQLKRQPAFMPANSWSAELEAEILDTVIGLERRRVVMARRDTLPGDPEAA